MNPDEFESRLHRIPLKRPPEEWRHQILAGAEACRQRSPSFERTVVRSASTRRALAATWRTRMRELFWPHPAAWGAMAALWLMIGAAHLVMRGPSPSNSRADVVASPNAPTLMSMQRELLAAADKSMDKPKTTPSRPIPPQSLVVRRRGLEVT